MVQTCSAIKQDGERCRSSPLHDHDFCFWHSPDHAEEAANARRLGGQRRRRESTLAGAYDVEGLETVAAIRRVIEIVTFDALGMDNSVARGRLLIAAMQTAARLLEVGELEERIARVEGSLGPRLLKVRKR